MKNRVFLYLFFMLVFVGCQKPESMEDFDALFTHTKSVLVKDCLSEELIMGRPFYMIYADSSVIFYDVLGVCLCHKFCSYFYAVFCTAGSDSQNIPVGRRISYIQD